MTDTVTTRSLDVPGATIAYDVRGPLPPADGRRPLLMIGQPMDAYGFTTLAGLFPDRTVVTYDPRGLGRSTRIDGSAENRPDQQAEDLHALVRALGVGPVDVLGSSGGAVTALAWAAAHPEDLSTVVAHEPPLLALLPDAEAAFAAERAVRDAYHASGWGAGMARFIGLSSWRGEFTAEYLDAPAPDPVQFGLPTDDDGRRDDPLLSGASSAVTSYRPDVAALRSGPCRVVIAAGVESEGTVTYRAAAATAEVLGSPLVVFPSHHGGFQGDEYGYRGEPEAFAARLREVLDGEPAQIVSRIAEDPRPGP
jgi:pimeloyl-ACP methyl ester carboxylesterase